MVCLNMLRIKKKLVGKEINDELRNVKNLIGKGNLYLFKVKCRVEVRGLFVYSKM